VRICDGGKPVAALTAHRSQGISQAPRRLSPQTTPRVVTQGNYRKLPYSRECPLLGVIELQRLSDLFVILANGGSRTMLDLAECDR
jgi:hypothetical protein